MVGRSVTGIVGLWFLLAALASGDRAGAAEVVISVNKATQSMSVLVDGAEKYRWTVSTGTGGGPPNGTFGVERMHRHWFSRTYNNAPMPYSIFFEGPYAIHGTDQTRHLGRRASKGCVRLHPRDAAVLFDLVRRERASTTIVISTTTHVAARVPLPESTGKASASARPDVERAVAAKPREEIVTGSTGARRAAAPRTDRQTRTQARPAPRHAVRYPPHHRARPPMRPRGYPPYVYAPYGPRGPVVVYEPYRRWR